MVAGPGGSLGAPVFGAETRPLGLHPVLRWKRLAGAGSVDHGWFPRDRNPTAKLSAEFQGLIGSRELSQ